MIAYLEGMFGERVGELPIKRLTLRHLAPLVGVGFPHLSRVETGQQTYDEYLREALIRRLGVTLDAEKEELLLLAEKIST